MSRKGDKEAITPVAPPSILLHVNRESRLVDQKFLVPLYKQKGVPQVFGKIDIDTIWLTDPDVHLLPEWDRLGDRFELGLDQLIDHQKSEALRVPPRIALSWNMFTDLAQYIWRDYTAPVEYCKDMVRAGVREVYFVVNQDVAKDEPRVVFKEPTWSPYQFLQSVGSYPFDSNVGEDDDWEKLAARLKDWLVEIHRKYCMGGYEGKLGNSISRT